MTQQEKHLRFFTFVFVFAGVFTSRVERRLASKGSFLKILLRWIDFFVHKCVESLHNEFMIQACLWSVCVGGILAETCSQHQQAFSCCLYLQLWRGEM